MFPPILSLLAALSLILSLSGCDDQNEDDTQEWMNIELSGYTFENHMTGEASVNYSGQAARHALLEQLKLTILSLNELTQMIDLSDEGDVTSLLSIYFNCQDDLCAGEQLRLEHLGMTKQESFGDISTGKNLVGKLAGNDPVGQTRDWMDGVAGWSDNSLSPEMLVLSWFKNVEDQTRSLISEAPQNNPVGQPILSPHISSQGVDYATLSYTFLLGAIAFSQASDDYLDDDLDGKGLLSDHTQLEDGENFTALEHSWDEGFGYFGAAQNYHTLLSSTAEGEPKQTLDSDQDGLIDLVTEVNWGYANDALLRDRAQGTDFARQIYDAFYQGRSLIARANGALSPRSLTLLSAFRDQALTAWEASLASTAIHHLNRALKTLNLDETSVFERHAEAWSAAKGYSLSFQFNPHSLLNETQLSQLHALIGDHPKLAPMDLAAYEASLTEARSLLSTAYGFNEEEATTW